MKRTSLARGIWVAVHRQFDGEIGEGKFVNEKARRLLMLVAFFLFAFCTASAVAAQTDPFIGTWKMNPAKSKFTPGPARKSETRIVVSSPNGMQVSVDRINGDGSNQQFNYTANLDGKSYPITGMAPYGADSVSVNLTAPNTLSYSLTKGGKVVGTGTSVVSADGKTLTLTSKGTDEQGKAISSVVVYDKQ